MEKGKEYTADEVAAWCFNNGLNDLGRHIQKHPPDLPFKTDGVSGFPGDVIGGINIFAAAVEHDVEYWAGRKGDREARLIADWRFGINIILKCGASAEIASTCVNAVRLGGSEHLPTNWRWGYGRK